MFSVTVATAAPPSAFVRVSQIGYESTSDFVRAYLMSSSDESRAMFQVRDEMGRVSYRGPVGLLLGTWSDTNALVYRVYPLDFRVATGRYTITVDGQTPAVSPVFAVDAPEALYPGLLLNAKFFYETERDGSNFVPNALRTAPAHLNDRHAKVFETPILDENDNIDTAGAPLQPTGDVIDASAGSLEEIERIVGQIRQAWPDTRIILRADSGFCREALLSWCETHQVDYLLGFARNERLRRIIDGPMQQAAVMQQRTGQAARVFTEFAYQTNDSWSRPRRVVAKAEQIEGKENPRYVVTWLTADHWPPQKLYEELYCARGDMENRIKEQYSLFAGRVSAATLRANQLRLYLSAAAYVLLSGFRRWALSGTGWARSQCHTIRLQLLRIGAQVSLTARKVWVSLASSYPHWRVFEHAYRQLRS